MAGLYISSAPVPAGGSVDSVARASAAAAQATANSAASAAATAESDAAAAQLDVDTHEADTANPHAVTSTQVGLGNVSNDAQLKRVAGDIQSFSLQTPIGADLLLMERSGSSYAKASATVKTVAGLNLSEWSVKTAPVSGDRFPIDDSAASF